MMRKQFDTLFFVVLVIVLFGVAVFSDASDDATGLASFAKKIKKELKRIEKRIQGQKPSQLPVPTPVPSPVQAISPTLGGSPLVEIKNVPPASTVVQSPDASQLKVMPLPQGVGV